MHTLNLCNIIGHLYLNKAEKKEKYIHKWKKWQTELNSSPIRVIKSDSEYSPNYIEQ